MRIISIGLFGLVCFLITYGIFTEMSLNEFRNRVFKKCLKKYPIEKCVQLRKQLKEAL